MRRADGARSTAPRRRSSPPPPPARRARPSPGQRGLESRDLPVRAGPLGHDRPGPGHVRCAAEGVRILGHEGEHRFQRLRERDGVAPRLVDQRRGHAAVLGAPEVLGGQRPRDAVEIGMEVGPAHAQAHEAAEQGGDAERIVEPRAGIGDAQFQRRELDRGAQRPPQEARIGDGARAGHDGDEPRMGGGIGKKLRQAGAGQLAEDAEPVRLEPRRLALPERRRGREGEQQRLERQQPVHEIDAGLRVRHLDMDMHPADQGPPGGDADIRQDALVAFAVRGGLARPAREGMRAAGEERQPILRGNAGEPGPLAAEIRPGGARVGERRGADLDLCGDQFASRLGEFRLHPRVEGGEVAARCPTGLGIGQEVFLLDAEAVAVGAHGGLRKRDACAANAPAHGKVPFRPRAAVRPPARRDRTSGRPRRRRAGG